MQIIQRPAFSQFRRADRLTLGLGPANDSRCASAFVSYKDRPEPQAGDPVRVYRNLLNGQYSVLARSGPHKGRVLGYAPAVGMTDTQLHISEKTRQKVKKQGVRNVHAWAEGRYLDCADIPPADFRRGWRVTYFPFVFDRFFERTNPGNAVRALDRCWAFGSDLQVSSQAHIHTDNQPQR